MFEQWEAVNVFGGALLGGLLEEAAHGNPLHFFKEKCRGFGDYCQGLSLWPRCFTNQNKLAASCVTSLPIFHHIHEPWVVEAVGNGTEAR